MIVRRVIIVCTLLALTVLFSGCSLNLASGTGVGNPGITTVSIIADEGYGEHIRTTPPLTQREIPVYDDGGLLFTVTSIDLNVQYINFIRAENADQIQNTNSNIPLDGPFLFDAMSGLSIPSIEDFTLPAGKYAEMRLFIDNKEDQAAPYAFEISGHFEYNGKKRNFFFKLQSKKLVAYKYKGPAFSITPEDSTLFSLVLNAEWWLAGINIGESLDNNEIALDQAGNLVIDNSTAGKVYDKLKKDLSHAIIKSGYLLITSLH